MKVYEVTYQCGVNQDTNVRLVSDLDEWQLEVDQYSHLIMKEENITQRYWAAVAAIEEIEAINNTQIVEYNGMVYVDSAKPNLDKLTFPDGLQLTWLHRATEEQALDSLAGTDNAEPVIVSGRRFNCHVYVLSFNQIKPVPSAWRFHQRWEINCQY